MKRGGVCLVGWFRQIGDVRSRVLNTHAEASAHVRGDTHEGIRRDRSRFELRGLNGLQ